MKTVLFKLKLKNGKESEYLDFLREKVDGSEEYAQMLLRYDMYDSEVWIETDSSGVSYVLVRHNVGSDFESLLKGWSSSEHPYDAWFKQSMASFYEVGSNSNMPVMKMAIQFNALKT